MSKKSQFQKTTLSGILVFSILIGIPIINGSGYGPPILSLVQPSSSMSSLSSTQDPFLSMMINNNLRGFAQNELFLEDFPNYATVLLMTEGRSWIKSEELLEILGKQSPNQGFMPFVVTPPEDHGIMVVIQELQIPAFNTFNRSLIVIDDNGRIMECFSKFMFQIEGKSPVEVCGRTNDQLQYHPSVVDGVGPRSFVVPVGKSISVGFIYRDEQIDLSASLIKQVPYYDVGYLFRASIAFTAYKACPHGPPFYTENNEKLWPCDIPQSSREKVAACIREELFCDNIIHCGMHDTKEFAVDEKFCKEKVTTTNGSYSITSSRRKHYRVDTTRLEEAIHNRIINSNRPFGYNDMIVPMGPHSGKGSHFATEPIQKSDTLGHPAFVALIILITIISVLIVGLIFRYCCNPCVGKSDPFGDSSNPEAVARFHENLQSRDTDTNGRSYGVTFENIFKPVDDLPPAYNDLFPQDVTDGSTNHKVYTISTTPPRRSSINEDSAVRTSDHSPPSVYSVPVSLGPQDTSRSTNSSRANGNQPYFLNPAFVHLELEVLPGNNEITPLGRRNEPIGVTSNSDEDNVLRPIRQNHHSYDVNST